MYSSIHTIYRLFTQFHNFTTQRSWKLTENKFQIFLTTVHRWYSKYLICVTRLSDSYRETSTEQERRAPDEKRHRHIRHRHTDKPQIKHRKRPRNWPSSYGKTLEIRIGYCLNGLWSAFNATLVSTVSTASTVSAAWSFCPFLPLCSNLIFYTSGTFHSVGLYPSLDTSL